MQRWCISMCNAKLPLMDRVSFGDLVQHHQLLPVPLGLLAAFLGAAPGASDARGGRSRSFCSSREVLRTASCTRPSSCSCRELVLRACLGRARVVASMLLPASLLSASTGNGASSRLVVAPGRGGSKDAARSMRAAAASPASTASSPCSRMSRDRHMLKLGATVIPGCSVPRAGTVICLQRVKPPPHLRYALRGQQRSGPAHCAGLRALPRTASSARQVLFTWRHRGALCLQKDGGKLLRKVRHSITQSPQHCSSPFWVVPGFS